jgi:3-methyladenine DNA glycosylase AlkD
VKDTHNLVWIRALQARLDGAADAQIRNWWEGYLRGAIEFRGVNMAGIRAALRAWIHDEHIAATVSLDAQMDLALALIRQRYAEDKLAGILYLQEVLLPQGAVECEVDLPRFACLFEDGAIYDWNTCDWFCVRVLGPLIEREGECCARAVAAWRQADGIWQRRAAGVAFVNVAKRGEANFAGFTDMLLDVCAATVQHGERFAQTGTAWVLRELSRADPGAVIRFVERHLNELSREALRSATEKLPVLDRTRLRRAFQHDPGVAE